MFLVILQAKS